MHVGNILKAITFATIHSLYAVAAPDGSPTTPPTPVTSNPGTSTDFGALSNSAAATSSLPNGPLPYTPLRNPWSFSVFVCSGSHWRPPCWTVPVPRDHCTTLTFPLGPDITSAMVHSEEGEACTSFVTPDCYYIKGMWRNGSYAVGAGANAGIVDFWATRTDDPNDHRDILQQKVLSVQCPSPDRGVFPFWPYIDYKWGKRR